MELVFLLILLGLCQWAFFKNCNSSRDRQWREWMHGDSGYIAPDGRDFHGRKVTDHK